jgi:hypothetical protein
MKINIKKLLLKILNSSV